MNRTCLAVALGMALGAAALTVALPAQAQGTVKIGLVLTLSGQFADAGNQLDNGIKTYMKQHGDSVAGRKIEIIRKDTGGPAPDVAKRLAQELVVRDKVDILAGFVLTPNAMAAGDVSAEAKKFMVVMNAATSIVITKSPYMVRTSVVLPQVMETFGTWAATKGELKQNDTMVTDYGPGHDAEAAFQTGFKNAGGTIVGSVRFPVANPDFSAFVQRATSLHDSTFSALSKSAMDPETPSASKYRLHSARSTGRLPAARAGWARAPSPTSAARSGVGPTVELGLCAARDAHAVSKATTAKTNRYCLTASTTPSDS